MERRFEILSTVPDAFKATIDATLEVASEWVEIDVRPGSGQLEPQIKIRDVVGRAKQNYNARRKSRNKS